MTKSVPAAELEAGPASRSGRWHLVADYSKVAMSPSAAPEGLIIGGDVVWARCPDMAYAEAIMRALVAADEAAGEHVFDRIRPETTNESGPGETCGISPGRDPNLMWRSE